MLTISPTNVNLLKPWMSSRHCVVNLDRHLEQTKENLQDQKAHLAFPQKDLFSGKTHPKGNQHHPMGYRF